MALGVPKEFVDMADRKSAKSWGRKFDTPTARTLPDAFRSSNARRHSSLSIHSGDHLENYHRLENTHSISVTPATHEEGFVKLPLTWRRL